MSESGAQGSRLIVFLHGMGQSPQSWQEQVVALPANTRAVAPWVYGMRPGRTDVFTLAGATDDVARTLDLQGAEAAIICGVSLGARIALEFAIRHPHRVEAVIAAGPPPQVPAGGRLARRIATRLAPRSLFSNQGIDKSKVVAAGKEVDRLQSFGDVERISSRVLLLAGSKDAGGVATSQRLSGRIDRSVVQVIEGAGHLVNNDAPAEFNQAVADFLG